MAGTLRMDYRPFTLRQLFVMFESYQLSTWDQITMNTAMLHVIDSRLINMFAKNKVKPKSFMDLHPFRKSRDKMVIKAKDVHLLKALFS